MRHIDGKNILLTNLKSDKSLNANECCKIFDDTENNFNFAFVSKEFTDNLNIDF